MVYNDMETQTVRSERDGVCNITQRGHLTDPLTPLLESRQPQLTSEKAKRVAYMAELVREGDTLVLKLTPAGKVEGVHGDIRVPLSTVQSVVVLEDVIHAVHGMKMPGSRLPGVFAMGTFTSGEETIFAIVHHHTKRGIKVILKETAFDVLIVGVDDPEQVVFSLGFEND